MVVTCVALTVAAVVVIGVIVAKRSWRGSGNEVHSVRHYQSALDAIEQMSTRNAAASVRVQRDQGQADDPEGDQRAPSTSDGSDGGPIVFDDTRARERRSSGRSEVAPAFRSDRARRHAIESMDHRPRRWGFGAAVVILIAAIGGLVYAGSHHSDNGGHAAAKSTSDKGSPTTAAHHASTTSSGHHHGSGSTTTKPSTTTTAPSQIVASSSSSSGTTAQYPVPTGAYQLAVTATTGSCWVDVTNASTGANLWTGTLQPGASQVVQADSQITVELGSPSGALSINGTKVAFPTPFHTPFTATMVPGSGATGGSTATTGSTTTTTVPAGSTGSAGSGSTSGSTS